MALDMNQIKTEALAGLTKVGTDIRKELWTDQQKLFLQQMAADVAGLTLKLSTEQDPAKAARYRRSLELIANHVAVMAFSRLNVVEQKITEMVLDLLEKVASFVIDTILQRFGIAAPSASTRAA
jgi:hypothetical protein